MPPKKRTVGAKKTSVKKTSAKKNSAGKDSAKKPSAKEVPVTELLAKLSSDDEVSNVAELKNETMFVDEVLSNCKTPFGLLNDTTKNFDFDEKSDQIAAQSSSSNELNNLSTKSSLDRISQVKSIIDKVRNLQIQPSVHIYSLSHEGRGISAVDVSKTLSHIAYAFPHSHQIHLFARESFPDSIGRNDLRTTWLKFVSEKNRLSEVETSENEKKKFLSSPRVYTIPHNNDVTGLCFSPNDNLLLSCSLDGSAKAINTSTYCVIENYDGHGLFTDIDVNFDSTRFVTTNILPLNPFHVAYLYTLERKNPVLCFSGHSKSLKCVRFHPNGLYIATASSDQSIKLWSTQQAKEVRSFKDEEMDNPEKITFSPDGKYIASTHTGCVKIWDIASGKKIKCLKPSRSTAPSILNVCYNSVGDMLAAGGSDKKIHFWNIMSHASSETTPEYDFLKSQSLGERIFSIKYVANFFSCLTG